METSRTGPTELTLRDLTGRVVLPAVLRGPQSRLAMRQLPKGLCLGTVRADGQPMPRTFRVVIN